jgi:hypothetical protein
MIVLDWNHSAMLKDQPLAAGRVRSARDVDSCLKSGLHNKKIGPRWHKKIWRDVPIYTLSLVERATCPACPTRDCCYGNAMPSAIRLKADRYLMPALRFELENLAAAHRSTGFSVRLHVLGDFYSEDYARFWIDQVAEYPGLHVFGFTSWPRDQPIGAILERESRRWDRFRIRFSVERGTRSSTVMVDPPAGRHGAGVTCPYERGNRKVKDCASCGLCLSSKEPIVFGLH